MNDEFDDYPSVNSTYNVISNGADSVVKTIKIRSGPNFNNVEETKD